jgi:elongation factor 1-gamma
LIAAQYSGAAVKVQENFVFGETNTAKDFLAKFPTGKVRVFQSSKSKHFVGT